MARRFTELEKVNIRSCLLDICKRHWTQFGYKKTNIDELCKEAGISKGAFYLFFDSKEAIFCDVLCSFQADLYDKAIGVMNEEKDKFGVSRALKLIYREYDKNNFLYHSSSADFTTFTNKLTEEQLQRVAKSNDRNRRLFLEQPYLTFKIKKDKAVSVIYSLIMNIQIKETLPYNHIEVFDFMIDHLVDDLFE